MPRMLKQFCGILLIMLLAACSASVYSRMSAFRDTYGDGEYCAALDKFVDDKKVCDYDYKQLKDLNLLEKLYAGDVLFQYGLYSGADQVFSLADRDMKKERSIIGAIWKESAAAIINNNVNEYVAYGMDALFVSQYEIMNALAMGNPDLARIMVNRGYEKQQVAADTFRKLISSRKDKAYDSDEKLSPTERGAVSSYMHEINAEYDQVNKWAVFSDITSPELTYLSGLYFMIYGAGGNDHEDAVTYLKRASGMAIGNTHIQRDLSVATAMANGRGFRPTKTAWVIIESGFAPNLEERRLDLPSFLVSDKVQFLSIAIPVPKFNPDAGLNIIAKSGNKTEAAQLLADVDTMFVTEFKEYNINRILRAVTSMVTKASIQYMASEHGSDFGQLFAALYSVGATSADVRSWSSLPNRVRLIRIEKNNSGLINIIQDGTIIGTAETNANGNTLIYVRQPIRGHKIKPKIIEL